MLATNDRTFGNSSEQLLRDWIEANIGGRVSRIVPQPRWRRGWYATVEGVRGVGDLYIRGTREADFVSLPFSTEARFHSVLERHDIPVPHVYGLCPDPLAIVMDLVPGSRDVARLEPAAQRGVSLQYADILARIHSIDPAEFEAAGLWRVATPADAALRMMEEYEASYEKNLKVRPEPFIEFTRLWLRRNVPRDRNRNRMCFVTGDPGQFLVDDAGSITTVHDFEMGYLGDPLADLAPLRARHAFEPMGELDLVFKRYAEITGEPLDHQTLSYYLVWWGLTGAMWITRMLAEPTVDHLRSLFSQISGPGFAMQGMAEFMGISLDTVTPPRFRPSRLAATIGSLGLLLKTVPAQDDVSRYRLDAARAITTVIEQADGMAAQLEAVDLDEVGQIIGRRPENWSDADAELEAFIRRAGPEYDAPLLRLFDRRRQRQALLLPRGYRSNAPGDIAGFEDRLKLKALTELLA